MTAAPAVMLPAASLLLLRGASAQQRALQAIGCAQIAGRAACRAPAPPLLRAHRERRSLARCPPRARRAASQAGAQAFGSLADAAACAAQQHGRAEAASSSGAGPSQQPFFYLPATLAPRGGGGRRRFATQAALAPAQPSAVAQAGAVAAQHG